MRQPVSDSVLIEIIRSPFVVTLVCLGVLAWFLSPLRAVPSRIDRLSVAVEDNTRSIEIAKQEAMYNSQMNTARLNNHSIHLHALEQFTGMKTEYLPNLTGERTR
jgi:hypothetical protein